MLVGCHFGNAGGLVSWNVVSGDNVALVVLGRDAIDNGFGWLFGTRVLALIGMCFVVTVRVMSNF